MMFISRLLWRPEFHVLLLLMSLIKPGAELLTSQYMNHDTLIYTLVGAAIYRDGILPYDQFFDHKPFLTYFFYGPLGLFISSINVFVIFSLCCLLVLAVVVHRMMLKRSVPYMIVLFLLSAATMGTVSYSGNTEFIFVPLQMLAITLALDSRKRPAFFLLSAATAVAATNVNYISALPLIPALLFCLYTSSASVTDFLKRSILYLIAASAILGAAFSILWLFGADLGNYFHLQYKFLTGYAGVAAMPSMKFLIILAVTLGIIASPLLPGICIKPQLRNLSVALLLLAGTVAATFFLSGQYFLHYLFALTAPAVVILLTIDFSVRWLRLSFTIGLVLLGAAQTVVGIRSVTLARHGTDLYTFYGAINDVVGDAPIMSMRVSVVPLYFTKLRPVHPLVWSNHPHLIHGEKEDQYYHDLLKQMPPFVLTGDGWCETGGAGWMSCDYLKSEYTEVHTVKSEARWPGYSLYQLNAQ